MRMERERAALVRYAERCEREGLVIGTAGNLSVAGTGDDADVIALTPSSIPYGRMTPADIVLVDADGGVVEGGLLPTSEWMIHTAVQARRRPGESSAVVHTHAPYATAVSALVDELPALHYYVTLLGGPPRVAPYATFGTRELADHVVTALEGRRAALMANHGAVTVGASLAEAFDHALTLEWLCRVWCLASAAGEPRLLRADQLADVDDRLERLQTDRQAAPGWRPPAS